MFGDIKHPNLARVDFLPWKSHSLCDAQQVKNDQNYTFRHPTSIPLHSNIQQIS